MYKILIVLVLSFSNLLSLSKDELHTIYDDNFNKSETNQVKSFTIKGIDYYIIYTFEYKDFEDEDIDEYRSELSLMAKSTLFDEIKKTDTSLQDLKLKYFTNNFWLTTKNRFILLSYVKKEDIVKVPLMKISKEKKKKHELAKSVEDHIEADVNQSKSIEAVYTKSQYNEFLNQSIESNEKVISTNKASLKEYQKLYELYRLNGDIYKANTMMDKIIQEKFKSNDF